jgi:single-strand DNA-binding protein
VATSPTDRAGPDVPEDPVNEPHVTLSGHVAAVPTLRMAGEVPVTSFRVGATPRRYDRAKDVWTDDETLWFTVTAWRGLAEHCAGSLNKGDKVLVTGRLTQSSWTGQDETVRTGLEVDAASVGLDLTRHNAVSVRNRSGAATASSASTDLATDPVDDPWRSTGETDPQTGEVSLVEDVAEQLGGLPEPAGV